MKAKVVGKLRRTGVGKTSGKPYDFIELHYVAPDRDVTGEAACTTTMDPGVFPYESIVPGVYNVEFDRKGRLIALTPVQATSTSPTK